MYLETLNYIQYFYRYSKNDVYNVSLSGDSKNIIIYNSFDKKIKLELKKYMPGFHGYVFRWGSKQL